MKNILFISPFFYPERISTGRYNTHLAKQLVRDGHHVEVITSVPFYPSWVPKRTDASMDGVHIHRGGAGVRYPRSLILRRFILEAWFACHVLRSSRGKLSKTDCVIAVFPPSLFCLLLTLIVPRGVPLIGIVHDLQAVFTAETEKPGWLRRGLVKAIGWVEKRALRQCERLVFVSHSMSALATRHYDLDPGRVRIAYPFITLQLDKPLWPAPNSTLSTLLPQRAPGSRHLIYCGALGMKQHPTGLKEFFLLATQQLSTLHIHVFSQGPVFDSLRNDLDLRAESRIHFEALIDETLLPYVYAATDLNLVPQMLGTSEGSLPSKLPNILAAGGKVMAICDSTSEIHELIREYGSGISMHTWQAQELVTALKNYLDTHPVEQSDSEKALKLNERVFEAFHVSHLADQILNQD